MAGSPGGHAQGPVTVEERGRVMIGDWEGKTVVKLGLCVPLIDVARFATNLRESYGIWKVGLLGQLSGIFRGFFEAYVPFKVR